MQMADRRAAQPEPRSPSLDHGRGTLLPFGFITPDHPPLQPGVFIIGTGDAFKYRPVAEGTGPYCGIALDRPVLDSDDFMVPANTPVGVPLSAQPVRSIGQFAYVDGRRQRIGYDRADRAFDMAEVLDSLLKRFDADPKHEHTGFLAESHDAIPLVFWKETAADGENISICGENVPMNAQKIATRRGWVYASHVRRPISPFDHFTGPHGWAGNLTLVGQIICITAVLQDRLRELIGDRAKSAGLTALRVVAGRGTCLLDWNEAERRDLEAVRGELWSWASSGDGTMHVEVESTPSKRHPHGNGQETSPPPLTLDHRRLLAFLAREPGLCRTFTQIADARGSPFRDRGTVGKRCREMSPHFVYERFGPKRGWALTPAGIVEGKAARQAGC
jgi:hypothetical protein